MQLRSFENETRGLSNVFDDGTSLDRVSVNESPLRRAEVSMQYNTRPMSFAHLLPSPPSSRIPPPTRIELNAASFHHNLNTQLDNITTSENFNAVVNNDYDMDYYDPNEQDNNDEDIIEDGNMYSETVEGITDIERTMIQSIVCFVEAHNRTAPGLLPPRMVVETVNNTIAFLFTLVSPLPPEFAQGYEQGRNKIVELVNLLQVPVSPVSRNSLDIRHQLVSPWAVKSVINDLHEVMLVAKEYEKTKIENSSKLSVFIIDENLPPLRNREGYIRQCTTTTYLQLDDEEKKTDYEFKDPEVLEMITRINRAVEALDSEARRQPEREIEIAEELNIALSQTQMEFDELVQSHNSESQELPILVATLKKTISKLDEKNKECQMIELQLGPENNNPESKNSQLRTRYQHLHAKITSIEDEISSLTARITNICSKFSVSVDDACGKFENLSKMNAARQAQLKILDSLQNDYENNQLPAIQTKYTEFLTVVKRYNSFLNENLSKQIADITNNTDIEDLHFDTSEYNSLESMININHPVITEEKRTIMLEKIEELKNNFQKLRMQWCNRESQLEAEQSCLGSQAETLDATSEQHKCQLEQLEASCEALLQEKVKLELTIKNIEITRANNEAISQKMQTDFNSQQQNMIKMQAQLQDLQKYISSNTRTKKNIIKASIHYQNNYLKVKKCINDMKNKVYAICTHEMVTELNDKTNQMLELVECEVEIPPTDTEKLSIWVQQKVHEYTKH